MLDYNESGGMFDSWIERWRLFQGIDKWTLIDGVVTSAYFVDVGEGGYYKLKVEYHWPPANSLSNTTISINRRSNSESRIGDIVRLRVNPQNPKQAVFANTSESATNLMIVAIAIAVFTFLLTIKACNAFFADPH